MIARALAALALALAAAAPLATHAQTTVNAVNDLPCAGSRGSTGCTAAEFTTIVNLVNPSPLDCVAGQYVFLSAQLTLSGTNADRYNVGWLTGQDGNDPRLTTGSCSVATMPGAPDPPWFLGGQAGNTCGDYRAGVTHTVTVNNMKVQCTGDASGQLQVPYTLIYNQNDTQTPACTGPVNVRGGSSAKCNAGTAVLPVNTFTVYGGVTITKVTQPAASAQSFAFTATSADPAQHPVASGDGAFSLVHGGSRQVRMRINGTPTNLTIAETLVAGWEPSTAITCTRPDGSSAAAFVTINNATRTITADLSNANPLANCTITNVKQPTVTLTKTSQGAVGGFTFTGTNGWASQTITTVTSGTPVTGATQTLTAANTATTITETIPAGYSLASVSCSGLDTGTATPNLATGAVVLDAAAMAPGNNVACTYVNNRLPTLTKAFSPTTVAANQNSTLTFTLASPAGALAQSAVSFTDALPPGLVLAPTPGAATTCSGTPVFTAAAGTGTFSVSGLTVPAGAASCTVSVAVRSATPATYVNGAAQITASTNLINGVTNQSLVVQSAATVAKSFAVASLAAGASTSLTVTLGNPNAAAITLSSAFTDAFPAGMTIGTAGNTGTCTGVTATAGASSFTVASGTSIPSGGCTVIVDVTSSTAGAALNTIAIGDLQTSAGSNLAAASATLNVYAPPTVTKTFTPSSIATGGTSSMVITVTNPAANPGNLTGVAIGDTYTGTLLNNAAGSVACSGAGSATLTGGANGGASVGFSGGTIVPGGTCTITQSVTATTTNANTTSAPTATGPVALTGTAANATLTIFARPTVSKAFGVASLARGGNTSLTVTIGNTNPGAITLTSLFTDTFPAGMTIGTAGNTGTCTGVTATAGAGSFTIANGTSIPSGGCTVIVNVTSSTAGTATNTIAIGQLATSAGTNAAAASATLDIYAPPTIAKAFGAATLPFGGSTTLTLTITNPAGNPGPISGLAFSDPYPAGLQVAATPAFSNTCGGTVSPGQTAGDTAITLTGGAALAAGASCQIQVTVTATTAGAKSNTTGAVSATGPVALTGLASNTAVTTVQAAPTLAKAFGAASIAVGGNTSLTVTVGNPNAAAITLTSALTDTFPGGMTIGTAGNTGTCIGVTATAGAGSFTIANGTSIPAGGCTVIVNVTSGTAGAATNTLAIGALQTSAGSSQAAASATLDVFAPPTVTKSFSPTSIASGGTSTLTIIVTNPAANPGNLTGVAVNDAYTGTLQNNAAGSVSCSGAGSATLTGGVNGGTAVGFTAGTIVPGGTCTITQSVTATTTNTNATNAPTATGPVALTGTAATGVVLTVLARPTVAKAFGAAAIATGGNTSLTVTIGNTNAGAITLTSALTDTFPGGMTIGTAGNTGTCTGVTATAGAGSFTIANGTSIPAGGCTVIVNVTSSTAGAALNSIAAGQLTTSAGSNLAAASATLNVFAPPTVTKSFSPTSIATGGSSTLTITVTNPSANPGNLTGVAVNDAYTGTLQNNAAGSVSCSGAGSATLSGGVNGGTSVGFTAGTIVPGGTCTITQSVTATTTNTNATNAPTASGPVALTGTPATGVVLTVLAQPTVAKAFGVAAIATGGNTSLTLTIGNPNAGAITLTSALTDTFPGGMTIGTAGNTGTCTGVTATAGSGSFTMANGTSIPAGGCTVIVNVTSSTAGAALNTIAAGQLTTSAGSNLAAASATLDVYAPPTVTKSFSPTSIATGGSSTLTITVTNPAANPGNLTGVAVNDAYTGTLQNNAAGSVSCSGAGSATLTGGLNGGTAVGFSGGTIVPGGTCTITQSVTATTTNTNATNAPTATGPVALTGTAATGVVLTVLARPTVAKAFGVAAIATGGNTSLTVTIGNTNPGAITLTSAFTDTFPGGMTIGTAGNTGTCTGVTATAGAGSFTIANGTSIPSGGCTVVVNVTSSTPGAAVNGIASGDLQTSANSNLAAASATLDVFAPPTVTKSFSPTSIAAGGTSTLTITVTNPAANPGNLTGVAVNDAYTGTLQNSAAGSVSCSGAGSATLTGGLNGGTAVGFSGGTIVPGGTCTITQSVTATTTNTNATDTPTATGPVALTGTAATGVVLAVLARPTVAKAFGAANLAVGGNTSLTLTIGNSNASAITLASLFTDTFPAGMTIGTAGSTGTCTGVTATAGAGSFTIANGTSIPAGGCTVIVDVTSSTAGAATNTIAIGQLATSAGTNAADASATLNVYAPPTVTKSFSPTSIATGGSSTLTITVTNPAANPGNLTGVAVNDAYTGTLQNNAAGSVSCSGAGSATLTGGVNGGSSVGFSAATIVPGGTCTITQGVTATSTNTNATNAPTASGPVALTGIAATGVVLTVQNAPTLAKSFGAAAIAAGGNTSLTVTIGNGNPGAITLTSLFTDAFPAGMTIGTAGNTGTCTGVTATAGAGSFTIANGTSIPSVGCTVIVNVTSATPGAATNTLAAGALQTSAGSNAAAASATLDVFAPPTVTKSFSPTSIAAGGTATLTITVTNPAANPGNLTGVAVDDAYTGTLQNSAAGSVSCSGAGSATLTGGVNGGSAVGFTAGTIVPGGTCTITQGVTATSTNTNATNAPTATGPVALTGSAATGVVLTVLAPPTVTKSFGAAAIAAGGSTSLTLTVGNTNAAAITLTSLFADTFPAGMTIGTAGNTGTCTGVTATAGAASLSIANGTSIPAGGCTVIVNVTSTTAGAAPNSVAIGDLQTSAGSNLAATSATLDVFAPPTVTKSFSPTSIASGGTSTLTIIVTNPAANPGNITGAAVNDAYTGTLQNNAAGSVSCSGAGSATLTGGVNGGTSVGFTAGTIVPGGTCTITQSVTATTTNTNATNAPTATGPVALTGTPATGVVLTVLAAPTVAKAFGVAAIATGGSTSLTLTLGNSNAGAITLTSAFTDAFPAGMTIGTAGNTGTCTGVTATAGAGSLSIASGTAIPAGGCTVIVNVTSGTAGAANNTVAIGDLQTSAGSNLVAASATLDVFAPPTVTKSFSPTSIAAGGASSLTVTVTNPAANPGNLTGVAINDAYTGTLQNNAAGSVSCSGAGSATLTGGVNGGTSVGFTAGTIVPGGTCTITQSVTATTTNTNATNAPTATGPVALTGTAATGVVLTVQNAPTVAKSFGAAAVATGGSTSLTLTIGNTNAGAITLTSALTDTFPAGMTIGTAGNTGTCTGVTATAGSGSFTIANGTSIPSGGCTVIVNVTSSTPGAALNIIAIGQLVTSAGSNAAAASATLDVFAPPTVTKSFSPTSIASGGTSTLTITVTNPAANPGNLTGVAINDAYTGTLQNNAAGSVSCSGAGGATLTGGVNGGTSVGFTAGTIVPGGTCTITQSVTATTTNTNATNAPTATGPVALTGTAATGVVLTVLAPPTVAKAFGAAAIAAGGNTSLTLTLGNSNAGAITLTSAFTDAFPAGMTIGTAGNTGTCTGVTATAGAGSISIASGTAIPAGGCTVIVNVTSSTAGAANNTVAIGDLQTSAGSNLAAASATLDVFTAPTVTKSFSPTSIAAGGTSTLTITVTNPAANPGNITGVAVNDAYTGTLQNNAAGSVSCSGAGSATLTGGANGGTAVGFSGGTIVPGGTCTITQSVTATSSNVNATNAPTATGPVALTGTAATGVVLTVFGAPTVAKSFGAAAIAAGGSTSLTVTLTNGNGAPITLTSALTDTFPGGMTIGTAGSTGTCTGVTATAGAGSFTIANGTSIPAAGCTVVVDVTSSTPGSATNTIPAGALQTSAGSNAAPASATLDVYAPPTVAKSFTPSTIGVGGTSTLTIVVTNPAANPGNLTGAAIGDTYAGTLQNAAAGSVSCSGAGSATLTGGVNGGTSVGFTAGTIVPGGTCTITQVVTATATTANTTTAPTATGPVALTGAAANATLTVSEATLSKAFVPGAIDAGGISTLTFTLANGSGNPAQSGIAFTDNLPAGVVVAGTPNVASTCPSGAGAVSATAGSGGITVSGAAMNAAQASCTISVDVTAAAAGTYANTSANIAAAQRIDAGGVSATLTVQAQPSITKAFGAAAIGQGQVTTLAFTIDNTGTNAVSRTGLAFSDALPAGLETANPPVATAGGGCVSPTLAGTADGATVIGASSFGVNAGQVCTITFTLRGATPGVKTNGAAQVTTTGLVNAVANQSVTVVQATLAKLFAPAAIDVGGVSTLTFTLANGAPSPAQSGIAFTDSLPPGVVVAATPNIASTCPSGTAAVTAAAGSGTIVVSGAAISAAQASCTISVDVTSAAAGTYNNTSANVGGVQRLDASGVNATLTVRALPAITKAFGAATIGLGQTTTLAFTLANTGTNAANRTGLAFSDVLPAGLVTANPPAATAGAGCAAATLTGTANGSTTIGATGIDVNAGQTCVITFTVRGATVGIKDNGAAQVTATGIENGVTTQTVTVVQGSLTKAFAPASIDAGGISTLTFTLANGAGNPAQSGIDFTDTLPAGVVVAATPNVASSCPSGTAAVSAGAGSGSIVVAGAAMNAAQASCTISVDVTSSTAGSHLNNAANFSAMQRIDVAGASATLDVAAVASLTKAFAVASLGIGQATTLTFAINNTAAGAVARGGIGFTDTLPAGLVIANPPAVASSSCGSPSFTAVDGTQPFTASNISVGAGLTCTITIGVRGTTLGAKTNTAASFSAVAGVTNNVTPQTVTVVQASLDKAFSPTTIGLGGTSTLTFTLTNGAGNPAQAGIAFTDNLPGNVRVAATPNIQTNCPAGAGFAAPGFTVSAAAGSASVTVSGLALANAVASCQVRVDVTASVAGSYTNNAASISGTTNVTNAVNASTLTVNAAAPTVAKAFSPAAIGSGASSTLTITVSNANAVPITLTSLTDTFPVSPGTGMVRAGTPATSTTCAGGTVSSTAGSVSLANATIPANGSCTFQIDVTAAAQGSYVNTIPAGAITSSAGTNAAAASATLMVTPVANLSIAKSGPASVASGAGVTYTIVVSNAGPDSANGAAFSDNVPAQIAGVAGSCGSATGGAACGTVNVGGNLVTSAIATLPSGGSVTFTITGTAQGVGVIANTATIATPSGTTDPVPGNNASTVNTTILAADLAITKTHAGSFTVGTNGTYTITVSNAGTAATSAAITVTDTLPAGLGFVSAAGTGWSCGFAAGTVTCTHAGVLAPAASAAPITLVVSVASTAIPSVTNFATASGGGEPAAATGNNTASDNTIVVAAGANAFAPDNTQTAMPGTSVLYGHVFNAGQAGNVAFTTSAVTTPAIAGWTQAVYRDSNCNGVLDGAEGNATLSAPVAVVPGDTVCILVRDTIPGTAPYNATNNITVSATFNGSQVLTRNDVTIVGGSGGSGLTLSKTVRNVTQGGPVGVFGSARPNDILEYTITYTNTGAGTLGNIVVTDATPAYTLYQAATCGALPGNLTGCTVTTAPAVNGTGSVAWTLAGTLLSNGSGSVSYTVRVSP